MTRLWGAVMATGAIFGCAAQPASARTEVLKAAIAIPSQALPGPNDPGRCVAEAFAVFDDKEGATSWSLSYDDAYYKRAFTKQLQPPFNDSFSDYPALFNAPPGAHQAFLAGASTGQGCGAAVSGLAGRFTNARVSVEIGQAAIRGTVSDADGGPVVERVTLTAKGRRTLHAATGPDGRYEIKVPVKALGAYTVTPSAAKLDFLPRSRGVTVKKGQVAQAHFRARGGCRAHAHSADVKPKDGLYAAYRTPGIAKTISLNYSCHTHVVIAKFTPRVTQDCPNHTYLSPNDQFYSERMSVWSDGSFKQSERPAASRGVRWEGQFTDSEHARVSFVLPDCSYSGRADSLSLVSEGPFVF